MRRAIHNNNNNNNNLSTTVRAQTTSREAYPWRQVSGKQHLIRETTNTVNSRDPVLQKVPDFIGTHPIGMRHSINSCFWQPGVRRQMLISGLSSYSLATSRVIQDRPSCPGNALSVPNPSEPPQLHLLANRLTVILYVIAKLNAAPSVGGTPTPNGSVLNTTPTHQHQHLHQSTLPQHAPAFLVTRMHLHSLHALSLPPKTSNTAVTSARRPSGEISLLFSATTAKSHSMRAVPNSPGTQWQQRKPVMVGHVKGARVSKRQTP